MEDIFCEASEEDISITGHSDDSDIENMTSLPIASVNFSMDVDMEVFFDEMESELKDILGASSIEENNEIIKSLRTDDDRKIKKEKNVENTVSSNTLNLNEERKIKKIVPPTLHEGVESKDEDDMFLNETKQQTFNDADWVLYYSNDGYPYYYNERLNESKWASERNAEEVQHNSTTSTKSSLSTTSSTTNYLLSSLLSTPQELLTYAKNKLAENSLSERHGIGWKSSKSTLLDIATESTCSAMPVCDSSAIGGGGGEGREVEGGGMVYEEEEDQRNTSIMSDDTRAGDLVADGTIAGKDTDSNNTSNSGAIGYLTAAYAYGLLSSISGATKTSDKKVSEGQTDEDANHPAPVKAKSKYDTLLGEKKSIEIMVTARSATKIPFIVPKHHGISWNFEVQSYDIKVGVYVREQADGGASETAILDPVKMTSGEGGISDYYVPADRNSSTSIIFVFDNTYSTLRSKTVVYHVELVRLDSHSGEGLGEEGLGRGASRASGETRPTFACTAPLVPFREILEMQRAGGEENGYASDTVDEGGAEGRGGDMGDMTFVSVDTDIDNENLSVSATGDDEKDNEEEGDKDHEIDRGEEGVSVDET